MKENNKEVMFPTWVGVILSAEVTPSICESIPHAGGGNPMEAQAPIFEQEVFPTRVGIFPGVLLAV